MENNKFLLSICIPTYNGGEKLQFTLSAIEEAVKSFQDVEIIVSDNCSTDTTPIVLSRFLENVQIRIYRNEQNLGFNRNMFLLVDKYAKGKYCWIIGDDDFIDQDSLFYIRQILLHCSIEYLAINYRLKTLTDYKNFVHEKRNTIDYKEVSFGEAVDMNVKTSNVLGTFMSSSIFLKKKFNLFPKGQFDDNSWTNYYSTFPNSYLMCTLFHASKCGCITTPLFTALIHEKSWDNKMGLIIFYYLPQLYEYYLTYVDEKYLTKTKKIIGESIFIKSILCIKRRSFKEIPLKLFFESFIRCSIYKLICKKIFSRVC